MRLVDFQVSARPAGLSLDQQKAVNEGVFPVYEALRLWLKERRIAAPFKKVLVSLADRRTSEKWHGNVMTALGVCEVTEAVQVEDLLQNRGQHGWTCSRILDALAHISSGAGWQNEELTSLVQDLSRRKPPCSHHFSGLSKREKNGLLCEVVLEADVDTTQVKVQFSAGGQPIGEVVVASRPGPLFMEDDFPVTAARIEHGHFLLVAKDKTILARVPLPP
jgi:hypothetical protein